MLTREETWTTADLVSRLGYSRKVIQRCARRHAIGHRGPYRRHLFTAADVDLLRERLLHATDAIDLGSEEIALQSNGSPP